MTEDELLRLSRWLGTARDELESAASELLKAERIDLAAQLASVMRAIDQWWNENQEELNLAYRAEMKARREADDD